MRLNQAPHHRRQLLIALALAASLTAARANTDIFLCRTNSNDTTLLAPFYWIPPEGCGFAPSSGSSAAPGIPFPNYSFYHNCNNMTFGDGWGLSDTAATDIGDGQAVVYEVQVTSPGANCSTDLVVGLSSANCGIGGVTHGTLSACTAFQMAYAGNTWSHVCYLTNHVGVTHPDIGFRYAGGVNTRWYVNVVRFIGGYCCGCLPYSGLAIQTPICTNLPYVTTTGNTNLGLQAICLYEKTNSLTGLHLIGKLTYNIQPGDNLVPVTWTPHSPGATLYPSVIRATGLESCPPPVGWPVCAGLRITSLAGSTLCYDGACATRFILLQSADPGTPRDAWQPVATNCACPGAFSVAPPAGSQAAVYYLIQSE